MEGKDKYVLPNWPTLCITIKPLNRISPYNININQVSDENKEKNQFVDKVDKLIQY